MTSLALAVVMFVVGAVLAVAVNAWVVVPSIAETRDRSPEMARAMAVLARSLLVALPIILAVLGAVVGPDLMEGST